MFNFISQVNNAGIALNKHITEMPIEDFDKVMRINTRAPFHFTKLAGQNMIKNKNENNTSHGSLENGFKK